MAARGSLTIIFPEQVQSVNTSSISSTSSVTAGGQVVTTTTEDGQTYSLTCVLEDGYKLDNANLSGAVNGGSVVSVTNDSINIMAGAGGIAGTLVITVRQSISTVIGKWKWNDNPVVNNAIDTVHITFICNNTSYTSISISNMTSGPGNICYGPTNNVVYGLDLGDTWRNQAYRTLDFGSSPQEVSDEFYNYLRANATQISSVSGVWVWNEGGNDVTSRNDNVSVNFTSNGQSYSSMVFSYGYDGPPFDPARVDFSIKYGSTEVFFATYDGQGSWSNQAYRTVDFGETEQEVSEDFYTYLTTYATKQGGEQPVPDQKAISLDNLQTFKNNCDTAYEPRKNIPTPTTANNGQVLGVTNGVYAFTEGDGVGIQNVQVVDADQSGDTSAYEYGYVVNVGSVTNGTTITSDIFELVYNNKCVGVKFTYNGNDYFAIRSSVPTPTGIARSVEFIHNDVTGRTPLGTLSGIISTLILFSGISSPESYSITLNQDSATISSTKKYLHLVNVSWGATANFANLLIMNNDSTPFTSDTLYNYLTKFSNGTNRTDPVYPATGNYGYGETLGSGKVYAIFGITAPPSSNTFYFWVGYSTTGSVTTTSITKSSVNVNDKVVEI